MNREDTRKQLNEEQKYNFDLRQTGRTTRMLEDALEWIIDQKSNSTVIIELAYSQHIYSATAMTKELIKKTDLKIIKYSNNNILVKNMETTCEIIFTTNSRIEHIGKGYCVIFQDHYVLEEKISDLTNKLLELEKSNTELLKKLNKIKKILVFGGKTNIRK